MASAWRNVPSKTGSPVVLVKSESTTMSLSQLAVHDGDQFLQGALITGAPLHQKVADVRLHDPPILAVGKNDWRLGRSYVGAVAKANYCRPEPNPFGSSSPHR